MNPKEKAIDLIDKMMLGSKDRMYLRLAKQCALIAVTEVINSNPHSNLFNFYSDIHSTMQYWIEVKNEIEKL